ncbi:MAG: radical SAM protein [Lachnospiraceae bacterium]|nr:radical SAM protein [Lachnospiraceae bacterium]
MNKLSCYNNIPEKLLPILEKWNQQGKKYYLDPDNFFLYNQHKIMYHGGDDIPRAGWSASNGNVPAGNYTLTKSDVEDIQQELLKYYQTTRWTLIVDWHCNYQCQMCPFHGNGVPEKENYFEDAGGQKKVVLKEEAFERLDRLAEYGIKVLSLSSLGEITLYPYWHEVSQYAKDKGIELWTITNGSLWTEDTVKEAVYLGYTNIRVSLDALSFETYAKIRSSKRENYERAMKLPELLMQHGITTNVHFVVQRENQHEVRSFLEYWKKKGVDSISIANEFHFEGEVVVNTLDKSDKEYIEGMCTAFGNMQTFPAGDTKYCCGMIAEQMGDKKRNLEKIGCRMSVREAVDAMRTANSELRRLCRQCSLYVPYNDEEREVDGWKVIKNTERETWIKMKEDSKKYGE